VAVRGRVTHTREEWEEIGKKAILDLLGERFVVPWVEVEARISGHGWKDFEKVQPVQLSGARRALRDDGLICEEVSAHRPPVQMIRLPYVDNRKRELERLVGRRRKAYRKYLSWAGDQYLCGKHAEKVVLESMRAAADVGLFVPKQTTGGVGEIKGVEVPTGPLDAFAHVLDLETVSDAGVVAVEVKNVNVWIYPMAVELWGLLVKAAELSKHFPVVPVLVCVRYAYQAQQMASDLGFFLAAMREQVFSPGIDAAEFSAVVEDFGLLAIQHEGPLEPVTSFFTGTLRRSPPLSQPRDEEIEWFFRQADRFARIAPIIEAHNALAAELDSQTRRRVFTSFAAKAVAASSWPLARGWS
jgi:hypothetical protein